MSAEPDLKPPRRIADAALMRELADAGQSGRLPCLVCAERYTEPHHVRLKSQGGDDVEDNIVFLCKRCHSAYHGSPYVPESGFPARVDAGWVRFRLARYLESEKGQHVRAYLVGKMGRGAADVYLKREFGIQS